MFVCVPPYLPLCVLCGSTETAWHPAISNCPSLGVLAVMGPFPERDSRGDWTKTSTGCLGTLQDWQQHTRVRQEHSTLLNSSACCFKSTAFPSVRAQRAGVVTTLETVLAVLEQAAPWAEQITPCSLELHLMSILSRYRPANHEVSAAFCMTCLQATHSARTSQTLTDH